MRPLCKRYDGIADDPAPYPPGLPSGGGPKVPAVKRTLLARLQLSRQGNDLVLDVLGADDAIAVQGWFAEGAQQLDAIQAGGSVLYANEVNNLVSAMAAFGAPTGGEISLTPAQREQVDALIAARWQP